MKKTIIYFAFLVCCVWLNSSCSSDPVGSAQACTSLLSSLSSFTSASSAYSSNPSAANCNAYKSAANKYLSDLKKCSTSSSSQISSTQDLINSLTC